MHFSTASLGLRVLSIFFTAILVFGLMPSAAFAANDSLQSIPEGSEGTASIVSSAEGGSNDVFSHCPSDDAPSADGGGAATSLESETNTGDESDTALPAGVMINQTEPLQVVAQQESTRSYFLAQTLESTRTIPVVSANLPLTGSAEAIEDDKGFSGGDLVEISESVDGDGGDTPMAFPAVVVGSFLFGDAVFSVEPGGKTVSLCAVNPCAEVAHDAGVYVVPSAISDSYGTTYAVTRIANGSFALEEDDTIAESSFTTVYIPNSVTRVESDAFAENDALTTIWVSPESSDYLSYDGCLYEIDPISLICVPAGKRGDVRLHPDTEEIDEDAAMHCRSITSLIASASSPLLDSENAPCDAESDAVEIVADADSAGDIEEKLTILEKASLVVGQTIEDPLLSLNDKCATLVADFTVVSVVDGLSMKGVAVGSTDVLAIVADGDSLMIDRILPLEVSESASAQETVASSQTRSSSLPEYADTQTDVDVISAETHAAVSSGVSIQTSTQANLRFCGWVSDYETALTCSLTAFKTYAGAERVTSGSRLFFDNDRIIIYRPDLKQYVAFGLTDSGGIGFLEYTYAKLGTLQTWLDVPYGPYGVSLAQDVFFTLQSTSADRSPAGYRGDTNPWYYGGQYWSWGAVRAEKSLIAKHTAPTASGTQIFGSIAQIYFIDNKVIVKTRDGVYQAYGLTLAGNVTTARYSRSLTGQKFDIPVGEYGIRTYGSVYLWLDGNGVQATAYSGADQTSGYERFVDDSSSVLTCKLGSAFTIPAKSTMIVNVTWIRFIGDRLLLYRTDGRIAVEGLTDSGGMGAVQYSYDSSGSVKMDVPRGPHGFRPSTNFYLWFYPSFGNDPTTVHWMGNGGTWSGNATSKISASLVSTGKVTGPAAGYPTRSGWAFNGWSKTASATSGVMEVEPLDCDSYYATWVPASTVKLMRSDGTDAVFKTLYYKWGAAKLYTDAACTTEQAAGAALRITGRTGYIFEGFSSSDGKKYIASDGSFTTNLNANAFGTATAAANVTLYAQWTLDRYKIDFKITVAGAEKTIRTYADQPYESESFTAPSVSETGDRRGYTFLGWSKNDPGTKTFDTLPAGDFLPGATLKVKDVYGTEVPPSAFVLYGIYRLETYPIHYDLNETNEDGKGGSDAFVYKASLPGSEPTSYTYDETGTASPIALPTSAEMTRPGYLFSHWYEGEEDVSDNVVVEIDPSQRAEDVHLKAAWTPLLSAIVPVETSKVVNFEIDTVSGTTKDFQDDDEAKTIELSTTTPHGVYLSVASTVNPGHELGQMLFPKTGEDRTEIDALIDSLGFSYATDESSDVDATKPTSFSFSAKGTIADDDRILMIGSEKLLSENAVSLGQSKARGRIKLMMEQDGSLTDLLIPIDRIGIATDYEGSTRFADIVWTIELASKDA